MNRCQDTYEKSERHPLSGAGGGGQGGGRTHDLVQSSCDGVRGVEAATEGCGGMCPPSEKADRAGGSDVGAGTVIREKAGPVFPAANQSQWKCVGQSPPLPF